MSIIVNLTPTEEADLSTEAMQSGIATADLVAKLLREHLISDPKTKKQQVLERLHQWQKDTETETGPRVSAHELFSRWDAEAAQLTTAEREAEDQLWEDFQKGINETRASLGMRRL